MGAGLWPPSELWMCSRSPDLKSWRRCRGGFLWLQEVFVHVDKGRPERQEENILLLFYQKQKSGECECWSSRCGSGELGLRMIENVGAAGGRA